MNREVQERFWAKIDKNGPIISPELGNCYIWVGSKVPKGYGRFWDGDKVRYAAQVAWELDNGRPFPKGLQSCHRCDFPQCVRSSHIFPGTNSENQQDSANKRRHRCARLDKCLRGHSLLDENNIYHYKGKRRCRVCLRLRDACYTKKMNDLGFWKSGQSKGWIKRRKA